MKRLWSFITSMSFMAFLFLLVAFAMAIATFVESSYGTPTAQALIYKTRWFEAIWILLGINLVNNLIKYRFFTAKRITLGLFHISFLVIILGAAITRYISYEGVMHIRENESTNIILSSDNYLTVTIKKGNETRVVQQKTFFSAITPNEFSYSGNGGTLSGAVQYLFRTWRVSGTGTITGSTGAQGQFTVKIVTG